MSAGEAGPSLSSQASSVATECAPPKTSAERRPNRSGSRSRRTGNRLTRTPLSSDTPAGSSFFHVT